MQKIEVIRRLNKDKYHFRSSVCEFNEEEERKSEILPNTLVTEIYKGVIVKEWYEGEITLSKEKLGKEKRQIRERIFKFASATQELEILYKTSVRDIVLDRIIFPKTRDAYQTHLNIRFTIDQIARGFLPFVDYKWKKTGEESVTIRVLSRGEEFIIFPELLPAHDEIIEYVLYHSKQRIKLLQLGVKPKKIG